MTTFTIGADVEGFLMDSSGNYVSAVGLIGGTKDAPLYISDEGDNLQEDNVLAEYAVSPSTNVIDFLSKIDAAKKAITDKTGLLVDYTNPLVQNFPDLDAPQAYLFGCTPDFSAWTLQQNDFDDFSIGETRTAGGHIHVGFSPVYDDHGIELVRFMDVLLGVPSVILNDNEDLRRNHYGAAGAYRPKDYGIEYRGLSPFWTQTPKLITWAYNQTATALARSMVEKVDPNDRRDITSALMGNIPIAHKLIDKYEVKLP